jgi:hypothetical protein
MISISEEKVVDYGVTARIATAAFGSDEVVFSADRMRWLYERSFGQGTTVLAVTDDGVKVGQIALLHQTIDCDGESCSAVQLVDFFMSKEHRSAPLIRRIYKEVEKLCVDRDIRFILAMPNANATPLNVRFLKLKSLLHLEIRAGAAWLPPRRSNLKYSGSLKSLTKGQAIDLLAGFHTPLTDTGLHWNAEALFNRINDPTCDYAVHVAADLVLISSARKTRGIGYTLLCGFFARPLTSATSGGVRALVRAACYFWKRPLFVYAGVNDSLPALPGFPLPARLRPPMLVQLRDLGPERPDPRFSRFQLIDSDFV